MTSQTKAFERTDHGADTPVCSSGMAWWTVVVLVIFSQFSIMDRQLISLLVDPIKADLNFSDTQMGVLQGLAFAMTYAVAGLPIGWAVDRYPRKIIVFFGVAIWSASAALCGLARNFTQMFLARSAVGMGEATVSPVAISLISEIFPPGRVGRAMGLYSAGFSIGTGVALIVGGWIVHFFTEATGPHIPLLSDLEPWQATFIATGAPGVLVAFLAFTMFEPKRRQMAALSKQGQSDEPTLTLGTLVKQRGRLILFCYLGFGFSVFTAYSVGGWTPAYMGRTFGWSLDEIGLALGITLAVGGISGSALGGLAVDALHRRGYEDASLITGLVATALSAPLLISAYFMTEPMLMLVLLGAGLVVFHANAPAVYSSFRVIAPPELRGRVTVGFIFVSSLMGAAGGPLAVGLVTDHVLGSEQMVGTALALVLSVALPLMVLLQFLAIRSFRRTFPAA